MPWCPKCRSEYREGVKRCPTCDERLVDRLPPRPPRKDIFGLLMARVQAVLWKLAREPQWEPAVPRPQGEEPGGSEAEFADIAPSPLERAARALGRAWHGMRAGFGLAPHCVWRASRLWQVWVLLSILVVTQVVHDSFKATHLPRRAEQVVTVRERISLALFAAEARWSAPTVWGSNLTEDIQTPLTGTLTVLGYLPADCANLMLWAEGQEDTGQFRSWLVFLWLALVTAAVEALASGGIYGWLRASIRNEPLRLRQLRDSALRNFLPLFGFFALLFAGKTAVDMTFDYLPLVGDLLEKEQAQAVVSAWDLITAPLALTAFAIVVWHVGTFAGIKQGLRIIRLRWPTVLAAWIVYLFAGEAFRLGAWVAGAPFGRFGWRPNGASEWIWHTIFRMAHGMMWAGLGLVVCIAFMLVVMRTDLPVDEVAKIDRRL
jgi:hypothetical protein